MALGHGSIAFVGFNADGNDNIAFVTLDAIPAGTVIFFQDNEWNGSAFNTGESSWSWTTASDIDPGVVVRIDSIGASQATDISTNVGTVAFVDGANRGLSASDEIVYAFIGSDAATPSSFLAAVGSNALTSGATLAGTDLIAGDTALSFGDATGVDIGAYNGSRSGEAAFADYRPAINDPANWQTQDSGGDQSADGTPPDAPFATTPFSLAVGEETQSVGFAPASVTVAHLEGNAGSTQFVFTVQRTGGTTGDVGFTGQITSTQAEAADFADSPALPIAFSGTIAAGATTADVTVNVAGDVAAETAEAFTLTLQSVANADPSVVTGIGAQEAATGSILDDDAPLSIGQVQGTGHVSSMAGQVVTLTGVVTAVDTNGSRGFYLQDGGDGTPLTSDGIFVFLPSGTLPSVGHEVQVTGKVSEFTASGSAAGSFSTTELTSVAAINDLGVGAAVAPTVIGGPGGLLPPTGDLAAGGLFFESLEGMLITVKTPVAVGPTNSFGEIFTVVDGDADPGNGLNATGLTPRGNLLLSTGTADFGDNDTVGGDFNPERIQIDDDNGLLGGFTAPAVNVGATLTDVTGVVGYSFGNYEVLATQAYAVQTPSPLTKETGTLTGAADRLLVASYNAENLDPGDGAVRFATIAQEIVATLNTPDIIALQEVQDNDGATDSGTTSAATTLQTLVDAIAAAGGPAYAFVDNPFVGNNTNGGEPGGNIRTAFLYRTDRVDFVSGSLRTIGADGSAVTGSYADQQTNPDNPFFDSRPPLVASFTFNGSEVTVINNHFTSKGGSAALLGSQQPPLNAGEVQRAAQAQAVNTFVDGRLAANPVANIIVAGDLNEFPSEQPMQVLKGTASVSGYDVPGSDPIAATGTLTPGGTPVLHDLQDTLPADQQYDYVFEGNSETLDHILASNALASGAQFDPVHINAEFADQTSDHDPLLASFSIPGFSLSNYVRIGRFDLPEPTRTTAPPNNLLAQEVSAVTYDWDTDTLFVVGDGGTSIVQISKSGQLIDSMTLAPGSSPQGTEFYDTEGLTYIGDGRFVMVEERDRQAVAFTYAPGTTLTRADTQTVKLGTFAGNTGLEGLSFDKQTGDFIFAKETDPESIFQSAIDFAAGTATNGSPTTENSTPLFDPSLLGLADIADVYSLANVTALQGQAASGNLLVLSQESGKIVETDRSGHVVSTLTLTSDPGNPLSIPDQQHEGVAMDAAGNLYVVSENGGGDFDHPQLWVFAPSAAPNQAPTAIALTNQTTAIAENTSTATRLKVADIVITDDGLGASNLALTGADAAFFEVDNTGLYIKAGTALDFEAKASYAVTVTVDDPSVGAAPDATAEFTLSVTDLVNENPGHPQLYVSEVAPWSSGNSPVAADWFEITNAGTTALDITGWKMDDSSGVFGSAVSLLGITSIGAGESVVFLETDDLAAARTAFINTWFGGTPPAGLQIGNYTGSGVGLSTGGDEVNLFDASGVLQAGISFGASPSGPFPSFNNAVGLNNAPVTTPSAVGENGAFAAANDSAEIGSPGSIGRLIISEVAPWSSGSSPVGADWFEVTNTSPFAIDITGWKVDDSSGSPAAAIALSGITSIAAGESVIFIETADLPAAKAAFLDTWFGANPPANLQIGSYSGSGVGLGTSGDAVNLYDAGNTLRASVTFGASPSGPFATFDNAAGFNNGTISALSTAGTNGAAAAAKDAAEVGSPGVIAPRPYTLQLLHFYGESGILAADTAPIVGAMVDKFRGEAANTLVLAEGDTWIPGPWLVAGADPSLNAVPGIGSTALGRPDVAIMNAIGVNASALGNHEFDLGSPIVSGAIAASGAWGGAQFPFITDNLDFSADASLKPLADASLGGNAANDFAGKEASSIGGKIAPYTIVTLNGERIGIVGLTTFELLSKTSPNGTVPKDDGNAATDDIQEVAVYLQNAVDALTAMGVNKIIEVDQLDTLTRNKALAPLVSSVDVYVAGGGHERLGDANDVPGAFNGHSPDFIQTDSYPIVTAGKDGAPTLIVTTDTEYSYLGRLQMQFDANGILDTTAFDSTVNGAYAADEATLQAVYGSKQSADEIVAGSTTGSKVQAIGDAIESVVIAKDGTKFGFSSVYLEGDRVFGRAQETNLGDLSADANIFKAQQALGAGVPAVVSLKNGGGLRASIGSIDEDGGKIGNPIGEGAAGNVSQLDVENALRFDNKLMVFDTTPQGLLNILNFAAGLAPGNGGFPQVGGIRFSYDPDLPADARVLNVALYDIDGNFIATVVQNGAVVADAPASIPVVILNFTAQGGDGYPIKPNGDNFRYLLNDGTLSAPLDDSLDFTAAANVPANALGEQKAFQDLMLARHNTEATAYDQADTPAAQDLRIENLNVVPTDAVIPCFAAGTRIMTLRGEVAVEHLREGDAIQGHFAAGPQDVVWIGQRTIDCRHHPEPHKVWPVCVARGAFGRGLPQRDLWLSPDHGVFVEGVLVPIKYLINDTSVRQMAVEQVTYYHVELPRHDVILAEGLPAESYLDTGDRSNFANGGGPIRLFADFSGSSASPYLWEAYGCAPLRIVGAEVEAARRLLRKRAARAKPNGRRDAAATDRGGKRRVGKAS